VPWQLNTEIRKMEKLHGNTDQTKVNMVKGKGTIIPVHNKVPRHDDISYA
jgi:hypothetical protein